MNMSGSMSLGYLSPLGKSSASLGRVDGKYLVTDGMTWRLVSHTSTAH